MERVLITGGAGFIGSNLAKKLITQFEVVVVDDLSMGSKENLPLSENLTFIEEDISEKSVVEALFSTYTFHYIYHLAAIASVADSVKYPKETHKVNMETTLLLLEAARTQQKSLKRIIFASSAAVYGDEPALPKHETSTIQPLTPYAIDKFSSENYILAYQKLFAMPTVAVRFFNVYGNNQNPSSPYSGVISLLVSALQQKNSAENKPFTIFGDGHQTRDFVFIDDVLQALQIVATKNEALGRVFNVGTGIRTSLHDIIRIGERISHTKLVLHYKPARAGDIKDSCADITALKTLGYRPQFTVLNGLEKYWQFVTT
ncbi:NAD-dependent epimerase/dehydratase family protein [Listeria fleischmannii]|uniref:NAD-dependent epimerase/dehydratase family protein n=1 Tax=Listeria fleischmannii TaxID=1069827 RepID=A0A841YI25_9LIST|nr:NAD-dependent epimerase/dehydratase family protein [Listeria fleischmannii]MBC1399863.1 NAD-dependent epimerase/dehydratase family protein [Listeria fleischmannii]MBC1428172.1 NAD-dependent epimerase/dehydratase family protein [Listeria fleischmannii]